MIDRRADPRREMVEKRPEMKTGQTFCPRINPNLRGKEGRGNMEDENRDKRK